MLRDEDKELVDELFAVITLADLKRRLEEAGMKKE